ncbi:hypothetical protein PG995_007825 [Apiospora arundinis]
MDSHVVTLQVPPESLTKLFEGHDLEDSPQSQRGRQRNRRVVQDDSDAGIESGENTGNSKMGNDAIGALNVLKSNNSATSSDNNSARMDDCLDASSEKSSSDYSSASSNAGDDSKGNTGMIINLDVIYEDLTHKVIDTMDVDHGASTGMIPPKTGPLSHPAIWTSYLWFRKAFPMGPPEIHNHKSSHYLGGFQAIIHSMAMQHPDLPRPTLAEFGATLKRVSTIRLKTYHPQSLSTSYDLLSAAKAIDELVWDANGSKIREERHWDIDAFVDDTHYFLQDHLALLLYIWGRDRKISLTLATWTNGRPWAYKVWDRNTDFATTTIVWIHHDGGSLYYGLGPLGSTEQVKPLNFTEEEVQAYWKLVEGASFTFDDYRALYFPEQDAGHRHNFIAAPAPVADPASAAESVPVAEPVVAEEPVPAEAMILDEQPAPSGLSGAAGAPPLAPPGIGVPAVAILGGDTPIVAEEMVATQAPVAGEDLAHASENPVPTGESASGDQPMTGMD